jgi:hypothetical protein
MKPGNVAERDSAADSTSARAVAPQAAILFDKFHVMRHLGEALDRARKHEYARLGGKSRTFIKGQKYVAAFLLMFGILILQFDGLLVPGILLLEIPLAVTGGTIALILSGVGSMPSASSDS